MLHRSAGGPSKYHRREGRGATLVVAVGMGFSPAGHLACSRQEPVKSMDPSPPPGEWYSIFNIEGKAGVEISKVISQQYSHRLQFLSFSDYGEFLKLFPLTLEFKVRGFCSSFPNTPVPFFFEYLSGS